MQNDSKGLDISGLIGTNEIEVWVEYSSEVFVLVRHVSREALTAILKKATKTTFDHKHQKQEEIDNIRYGELIGEAAIADWTGLRAGSEVFPCTPENIHLLMRKWADFAKFISDVSSDLERLIDAEKESVRKNSGSTSRAELIIQQ